jgi:hypothetical protein
MQLAVFAMPKKQHFEFFSRVGLCDPPSGFLCLTFCEMAKSSHEQSARATILNSNRPKPWADGGLDHQKVTTLESTQKTSDGDPNIKKLHGPLYGGFKRNASAEHNCAKGSIQSKWTIKEVKDSEKIMSEPNALFHWSYRCAYYIAREVLSVERT